MKVKCNPEKSYCFDQPDSNILDLITCSGEIKELCGNPKLLSVSNSKKTIPIEHFFINLAPLRSMTKYDDDDDDGEGMLQRGGK